MKYLTACPLAYNGSTARNIVKK